jgi:genome maintenance exonuclease 1
MKFVDHNIPKIKRIDGEVRLYETPAGALYPSVTSVVGFLKQGFIQEWRDKVGEEAANKISKAAADRGTLIHENCERFLRGEELKFGMFDGEALRMFRSLMPVLLNIGEVHAMETQMWSDALQVAGTVDLIATYKKGEMYVIDWKTSNRYKCRDDIHDYFMQASAYAMMFYERTGIVVKKIKIAMATEEFGLLQFEEDVMEWLPRFRELRQEYKLKTGK